MLLCCGIGVNPATPRDAKTPSVFAHYYTWWGGEQKSFPLMPSIGWYVNQTPPINTLRPPSIFQQQIREAKAAGLAGFSLEWCGRQSPETGVIVGGLLAANNSLPPKSRIQYLFCFDSTIWAMNNPKLIRNWYEPIVFNAQTVEAFAAELRFVYQSLPKLDPNFRTNYLHVDGRPAVFIYNVHHYAGDWKRAIERVRDESKSSGGVYLIGDFEVSPHEAFDRKLKDEYPGKAAVYDAVTDYTLFSGYPFLGLDAYIRDGHLKAALANGRELAKSSIQHRYYPGIICQYFKSREIKPDDRPDAKYRYNPPDRCWVTDGTAGLCPIYSPSAQESAETVKTQSRRAMEALLDTVFQTQPEIVFITSWNEPYEGTMIEPTQSPNPAGFVMGTTFLDLLRSRLRPAGSRRASSIQDRSIGSRTRSSSPGPTGLGG
jgi:hypothetical protein